MATRSTSPSRHTDGMRERTVIVNGFSKAFAMTGWRRLGYACAPRPLLDVMLKIHQYTIMCAATPSQYAAVEALRTGFANDFADVRKMVEAYDMRRRLMVEGLRAAGLPCHEPMGAFYVFPSVKETGLSSQEFCQRLLYEKKVATVPGRRLRTIGPGTYPLLLRFLHGQYRGSRGAYRRIRRRLEVRRPLHAGMDRHHAVTDRPMTPGQRIVFDENHHSGVYARVMARAREAQDCYEQHPRQESGSSSDGGPAGAGPGKRCAKKSSRTAPPGWPACMWRKPGRKRKNGRAFSRNGEDPPITW